VNDLSNWIDTGNPYADDVLYKRFMDDPVLQALIEYLERKGLLNKVEFAKFLNDRCRVAVEEREEAIREQRRESQ
jgi:hypothetical protein